MTEISELIRRVNSGEPGSQDGGYRRLVCTSDRREETGRGDGSLVTTHLRGSAWSWPLFQKPLAQLEEQLAASQRQATDGGSKLARQIKHP